MPRLPKGMVRKRKAYYWRYQKEGREYYVQLGSDQAAATKRFRELRRDGTIHRSELTVTELAQKWLSVCVSTGRNEKNQHLAAVRVQRYLAEHFAGVRVSDLKPMGVRSYRLWLETHDLRPATVKAILGDLRTMLRWGEDEGLIDRLPFPRRIMPRIQEQPPDRLTDEEVQRLLAIPEPYACVIRLGLETGLRWGELSRVRVEDWQGGMLVIHQTKSGKVRRVPCSAELIKGRVGLLNPFRSNSSFQARVKRLSGISRFHAHQLRHTFACRWLEQGGSLAALQEILGHSTIVVTQRYARLNEAHVRAEVERLQGRERTGNASVAPIRKSLSN